MTFTLATNRNDPAVPLFYQFLVCRLPAAHTSLSAKLSIDVYELMLLLGGIRMIKSEFAEFFFHLLYSKLRVNKSEFFR